MLSCFSSLVITDMLWLLSEDCVHPYRLLPLKISVLHPHVCRPHFPRRHGDLQIERPSWQQCSPSFEGQVLLALRGFAWTEDGGRTYRSWTSDDDSFLSPVTKCNKKPKESKPYSAAGRPQDRLKPPPPPPPPPELGRIRSFSAVTDDQRRGLDFQSQAYIASRQHEKLSGFLFCLVHFVALCDVTTRGGGTWWLMHPPTEVHAVRMHSTSKRPLPPPQIIPSLYSSACHPCARFHDMIGYQARLHLCTF